MLPRCVISSESKLPSGVQNAAKVISQSQAAAAAAAAQFSLLALCSQVDVAVVALTTSHRLACARWSAGDCTERRRRGTTGSRPKLTAITRS